MTGLLEITDLSAGYGAFDVLTQVGLNVKAGEIVALVGANGAGKTTLLRALMGEAQVTRGSISLDGQQINGARPKTLLRLGIGYSPQGRHLFPSLTVYDNLHLGLFAFPRQHRTALLQNQIYRMCQLFPALSDLLDRSAAKLSGGQQQMVSLARALMSRPRLLLLDEPSMGLAPAPLKTILAAVQQLSKEGVATLLVEQVATISLSISDRAYVLRAGQIRDHDDAATLRDDHDRLHSAYFGT